METAALNKVWKGLSLATLLACGGCSALRFEPTAHWLRDGGRLCASDRDAPGYDWDRPTPRTCAQALSDSPAPPG